MKKILIILMTVFCTFSFVGCKTKDNSDVIRIHIRANSNSDTDQSIKLEVRDNIIKYITPLICDCKNSNEVKSVLDSNLTKLKNIADETLENNGFKYLSTAILTNEYFPTRSYENQVFEAGYYDALIVNLGSGAGNNWWCVAYPPMCFVGEDNGGVQVEYKSKLIEIINKFFGK